MRKWKEAKEIEKKGEDTMNWNGGLEINKEWKKVLERVERTREKEERRRKKNEGKRA